MACMTLAQAQAQLDAWLAASLAVSQGEEKRIGDRTLKFSDLGDIQSMVKYWQEQCGKLERSSSNKAPYIISRFNC